MLSSGLSWESLHTVDGILKSRALYSGLQDIDGDYNIMLKIRVHRFKNEIKKIALVCFVFDIEKIFFF